MAKRVNYLNNKDLLAEIHKSKLSFCWFNEEEDTVYDIIISKDDDITDDDRDKDQDLHPGLRSCVFTNIAEGMLREQLY